MQFYMFMFISQRVGTYLSVLLQQGALTIAWYMSILVHVYPVKFSPASSSIILKDVEATMASTAMPALGFASYHVFALPLARKQLLLVEWLT